MSNLAYKVGHDAEFIVMDSNLQPIPVWATEVGGTKLAPKRIENSTVGTTYQEDGAMIELGMEPCSINEFAAKAAQSFQEGTGLLARKGFVMMKGADATFKKEHLLANPAASILGCNPDNDAYTRGGKRASPLVEAMGNRRFAAGHLHFSFPDSITVPKWAIVQLLDALALTFWAGYNASQCGERYKFYGMPGVYRDKPYGIEYRTPHNGWISGNTRSNLFVKDCSLVIQGIGRLTTFQVKDIYDKIDWTKVKDLLDLNKFDGTGSRSYDPMWTTLLEIRDEISPVGELE